MSLRGKSVLITRAAMQAKGMASLLIRAGADPLVLPLIELFPPSDPTLLADAVARIDAYDWILFTSGNGARAFWEAAQGYGRAKIAAVGEATAMEVMAPVALVPDVHTGEAFAQALVAAIPPGSRVLLARAEVARDVVPDALRAAGVEVDVVPLYRTMPIAPERITWLGERLRAGTVDVVTLASSSAVDALVAVLGDDVSLLGGSCVASIGPITTATAEAHGLRVDVTAAVHTMEGLVASLETHFRDAGGAEP